MKLSSDGKTLISVDNRELENGKFLIPNTVVNIGEDAFKDCLDLIEIKICAGITIEKKAFEGCINLIRVNIYQRVKVGAKAFKDCNNLKYVFL